MKQEREEEYSSCGNYERVARSLYVFGDMRKGLTLLEINMKCH